MATQSAGSYDAPRGASWVAFAGIMLMLAGVLNLIYGISAAGKSEFYDTNAEYLAGELKTWGWIGIVLGAAQIGAALSIWRGGQLGRWFGLLAATFSAVAALMSLPGYPLWSLCFFTLDVLVIYGLAAYGGQHRSL